MTNYPLEWGWHTSSSSKSAKEGDTNVAAWGDRKCEGCAGGGDYGTTATHIFDRVGKLCRKCALKHMGAEDLPDDEQIKMLRPFELKPGD